MQSTHEITVDRKEFQTAVGYIARGKLPAKQKTLLYMGAQGFTVETPMTRTAVKSVGRWLTPVAMNALAIKRLIGTLPASKELTLIYFDHQLAIGKVKLSAEERSTIDIS